MLALIIFILFLAQNVLHYFLLNETKKLRYRQWYRPWLLIIVTCIALFFKDDMEEKISEMLPPGVLSYNLGFKFIIDILFCISLLFTWMTIKSLLNVFKVNDFMEKVLKEFNTNRLVEKQRGFANYLVWPYLIQEYDVHYRPGYKVFRNLIIAIIILLIIAFGWSAYKIGVNKWVLPNGLGMILITIFLEWLLYFQCSTSKQPEVISEQTTTDVQPSFQRLYRRYIDKEKGFFNSIIYAYSHTNQVPDEQYMKDSQLYLKQYVDEFNENNKNFILSANNFTDFVPKMSEIFFDTLKKGGNILMVADIPNHTKYHPGEVGINFDSNQEVPTAKLFTVYLEQLFDYLFPSTENIIDIGYFSSDNPDAFKKRIVLCGIEDAVQEKLLHSDWIKELDLLIVFDFNDTYVDNLTIKRQFSLWLKQQNVQFKTAYFRMYRAGGDEALTNTWLTDKDVPELKVENLATAHSAYFINYAFEHSGDNLMNILQGKTTDFDLAPGIELSLFPIMEGIDHVHYFEGYHLDYIQSKNKLESSQTSFLQDKNRDYNYKIVVTQAKLKEAVLINNLPFIVHPFDKEYCKDQHLSVVYDIENNAPKLYQKYRHLGKDESFVCIVSKPHLFREYFAENTEFFIHTTFEALDYQLSEAPVNLCLQLLKLLKYEDVDMRYIKHLVGLHTEILHGMSIIHYIQYLFKKYLHIDTESNAILTTQTQAVFINGEYKQAETLTMHRHALQSNDIFSYLQKVKIVDSSNNEILFVPKYMLFQNFLPGQNIIINGVSYEYNRFDDKNNELILNPTTTSNYTLYKPFARILFEKNNHDFENEIDVPVKKSFYRIGKLFEFSLMMYDAPMEICYLKYFRFRKHYHSHYALQSPAATVDLNQIPDFIEKSKRKYSTRFLKLKWDLTDEYISQKAFFTTRIHHLLAEILPILFPYRHNYIQIVSDNTLDIEHRKKVEWLFPENNFSFESENSIEIYIIEDSFSDLGILKSIQIHFEKIIKELYFYLRWITDNSNSSNSLFSHVLKGDQFYKDKLQFLKYGLDENDIEWKIEELIQFIKANAFFDATDLDNQYKNRFKREAKDNSIIVKCDYCNNSFKFHEVDVMPDGLHRCKNCGENSIDQLSRAQLLKKDAEQFYQEYFSINATDMNYSFEFVTATELHQQFGIPFTVTNNFDQREKLKAASNSNIDKIVIERFRKEEETIAAIIFEMMHIYQFHSLNYLKMKNNEPELIDGMAVFAVYYLMKNSGKQDYSDYAENWYNHYITDSTYLGNGFRHVLNHYGENMILQVKKKYDLVK